MSLLKHCNRISPMNSPKNNPDLIDWIDALENLLLFNGEKDAKQIINEFFDYAQNKALIKNEKTQLPFENSIGNYEEIDYPGNWDIEESIRHYIRWNALVTVLKANKELDLGGHISTYSSAATLYEVGFNHFLRVERMRIWSTTRVILPLEYMLDHFLREG